MIINNKHSQMIIINKYSFIIQCVFPFLRSSLFKYAKECHGHDVHKREDIKIILSRN